MYPNICYIPYVFVVFDVWDGFSMLCAWVCWQERWPDIAGTLDTQSRVVVHPDGEMRLSKLGGQIQELLDAMPDAMPGVSSRS